MLFRSGLGAAQAVQEAGLTPGEDVKIATIDGTKAALEALAAGTLSFVAEYNPLLEAHSAAHWVPPFVRSSCRRGISW